MTGTTSSATDKHHPPASNPWAAHASSVSSCPAGFACAGLACGVKPSGADDLAIFLFPKGANVAAVFTRNLVRAAPVVLSEKHLAKSAGRARALIINSGCANAATGEEGHRRAVNVVRKLAEMLDCPIEQVLTNSTGVIGVQLPDDKITTALPRLIESARPDGVADAAAAIMTTDTCIKVTEQTIEHDGRTARIVGIAKGAGMIHPDMATMIAVIMTDAACEPPALDKLLHNAVEQSFHRITVDGDTSTNDGAFLFASGEAGMFPEEVLAPAVNTVARSLAEMIVRDGEGASKLIRVRVSGAATNEDALRMGRTVASSLLVRTSIAGADPNWGRILAAAGRSGVDFDPQQFSLDVNGLPMYRAGAPADTPMNSLRDAYSQDEVILDLALGKGTCRDEFITCDLTEQYVHINAEYTS